MMLRKLWETEFVEKRCCETETLRSLNRRTLPISRHTLRLVGVPTTARYSLRNVLAVANLKFNDSWPWEIALMRVYRILLVAIALFMSWSNAWAQFRGGAGPEITTRRPHPGPDSRPARIPSQQMPSEEAQYKLATPCTDEREARTLSELLDKLREDTLLSVIIDYTALSSESLDPDMIEISGRWERVAWAEVLEKRTP